ncbi:UPF0041-domain-containing protein [Tothia fuscella]|uniref:Mitochondrial pyruvate carrier n=1 Tax=Tothia fuscella TaxID=1048955 RepID=A0A9P4NRH7_9PEZI|nr:UPF0041-domain-containing protein [Tothia fuscella]
MSQRAGLRLLQARTFQTIRTTFRQPFQRRIQTATEAKIEAPTQSQLAKLWNSPVGPKTVHFWAPIMKWGVVLTGVSDFARPAESLSLTQNLALTATGIIWTRWCFIIKPRNIFLATVNFFLGVVGFAQTCRIVAYNRSVNNKTVGDEAKEVGRDAKGTAQEAVAKAKEAVNVK